MKRFTNYRFLLPPFLHQREEFLRRKDVKFQALFWDMGIGKTKYACDKGQYLYQKKRIEALVFIAPKGVHTEHISKEVPKHIYVPHSKCAFSSDMRKKERLLCDALFEKNKWFKIAAINTDAIKTKRGRNFITRVLSEYNSLLVVDESSDFSNKTIRTKVLLELGPLATYRMIMDGTPISTAPSNLYYPFEFLEPGVLGYRTHTAFRARYERLANGLILKELSMFLSPPLPDYLKEKIKNGNRLTEEDSILISQKEEGKYYAQMIYNLRCEDSTKISGHLLSGILPPRLQSKISACISACYRNGLYSVGTKNEEELSELIAPYSSRVLLEDALDLPEFVEQNVTYDLSKEERKLYNQLKDKLFIELEGGRMTVGHALTLYLRLQQLLGGYYFPDFGEHTESIPIESTRIKVLHNTIEKINPIYKIIIWARFHDEIDTISNLLKQEYGENNVVLYTGKTKTADRERSLSRFAKDNECRFLVGTARAGGVGLNLVSANYMIFFSKDFAFRYYKQAIARFYREGQKLACTLLHLSANNTIDNKIEEVLAADQNISDYITGDYKRLLK